MPGFSKRPGTNHSIIIGTYSKRENEMMRRSMFTAIVSFILIIGIVGSVMAVPKESQNLRGLGGRVFLVDVEVISTLIPGLTGPVGFVFQNCYFFANGGVWTDPGFPVDGTWMQHSTGANTTYTAVAQAGDLALIQEGAVTPAHGAGILQLEAFSTLLSGDLTLAEFLSDGAEVDECPF